MKGRRRGAMKIDDLKIIMSDLIREPKIQDEKYKHAYVDGVLDFFNKVKAKLGGGKMKIKCGRHEYELKEGDYILDNGACYQFIPKDNSLLPCGKWERLSSVRVSKKEFNRIIVHQNFKIKIGSISKMKYYFWNENDHPKK